MHNIELVIFDMAGTTVNEDNVVYKTLQKAINKKGYNIPLNLVLEHGAGKEKLQAATDILKVIDPDSPAKKAKDIFEDFKVLLKEAYQYLEVTSYDGVEELIQIFMIAGVKVALNTGYDKSTADLLLSKMNWQKGSHFDVLITANDVENGRPHPDMIFKAMEILNINDAAKVLKAGDSVIDIEEGKNAHCGVTVGVTTGAHTREQLATANPTYILNSLSELKNILMG